MTPAMRLSFRYVYAAMPVGFGLLIIHLLLIARPFVMAGAHAGAGGDENLPGAANG